jgi:hypothetical protein
MWPGTILDGQSLAIVEFPRGLRQRANVVLTGVMIHDGENVFVRDAKTGKTVLLSLDDLNDIQPVGEDCRIPEIMGFDFFLDRNA